MNAAADFDVWLEQQRRRLVKRFDFVEDRLQQRQAAYHDVRTSGVLVELQGEVDDYHGWRGYHRSGHYQGPRRPSLSELDHDWKS